MKMMPVIVLTALLFFVSTDYAHASPITVFTGETLGISGVSIETTPATGNTTIFSGFLTIGSLVPSTTNWTLTAFHIDVQGLPLLVWNFSGLLFDAANDTVFGTATTPYTDNTGSRLITANFLDGNASTNTYSNLGNTNPTGDNSGTFGYTVSTPEPSSGLLLLSAVGLATLAGAWRKVLNSRSV